jgi:(p)ppGpp synthase/HD superfamily hydrolase
VIFDAIEFAAAAHSGQYRKGTEIPYLLHPLGAARMLIDARCPQHVVVAAVLHDVLEDTARTATEIRSRFGGRVAEIVEACTEPNHRVAPWEARKQHTLDALGATPDHEVLLVAIADKLDNVRSIREDRALRGESTWLRFNRGREHQEWYYRSLLDVFERRLKSEPGRGLAALFRDEVERVFNHP